MQELKTSLNDDKQDDDNRSNEDQDDIMSEPGDTELDLLESAGMIKVEKIYYNILRKTKYGCGKF